MKLLKNLLICFAIQLSSLILGHAGEIVMTTSDSAPTYNNGTEVVIGTSSGQGAPTTTVTLTTTCTNGTVSVSYTPSSGVTQTSDTGSGTTSETTVFAFNSSTVGVVNTIKANISHSATTSSGSPCLPNGDKITFKICVPQISVAVNGGVVNRSWQYNYGDNVSVNGVDDLSQIEFTQLISAVTTSTSSSGSVSNVGTGVPYNCTNQTDTGWEWQVVTSPAADLQNLGPISQTNIVVGGQTYQYCVLAYRKSDFTVQVCRTGDTGNPICSFIWGFQWDNYNSQWTGSSSPPEPSGLGDVVLAGSVGRSTPGEFYGIYGITGL